MDVIETVGLRKEYRRLPTGRTVALDGLDLSVPEGGVFGFLGPNGAGKTTTIRCLLGLVRPTGGRCRLLRADVPDGLSNVIGDVGSIVETPAAFPRFTGRTNLELLARVAGVGRSRVREVLAQVGLEERADDLVRTYSFGMKQRLGIGAALLKDPQLLLLDEPANGLDPAGIVEVRELLRRLGSEGRTVFVSSHILSEVQHVADHVAIVSRGRAVTSGPVAKVLTGGRATELAVRLDDLQAGRRALEESGMAVREYGGRLLVQLPPEQASSVTHVLAEHGLYVSELRVEQADLETVFLELTEGAPP